MTVRRAFLKWLSAVPVLPTVLPGASAASALESGRGHVRLEDERIGLQFDDAMRCRVVRKDGARARALTRFDASAWLALKGRRIERFALQSALPGVAETPLGAGQTLEMIGRSIDGLEKQVTITLLKAWPGTALVDVAYVNRGAGALEVVEATSVSHRLLPAPRHAGGYWTYSGATHRDRRNWAQPVGRGFEQRNFMGMNASDYGGGTPVVDVWRRDVGVAVGHLELVPRLVALPVRAAGDEVDIGLTDDTPRSLGAGETLRMPLTFISVHAGDFYAPLDRYRKMMNARGISAPRPPANAYEPVWCAWGYEREFSPLLVRNTLPKVQELGLKWVVLDDGWQVRTGDWRPDPAKFPRGDADMKAFVDEIHSRGLLARLWIAPLAVAPGSDELHDHSDELLLDQDGVPQLVTWWNSFYVCPAYAKTQQRMAALVRKIIGEWGFDGLKVDGQHLNGVAPCYNPAHQHAHPRRLHATPGGLLPRAVRGREIGEAGRRRGGLPLRDRLRFPQHALHRPGAGLRPRIELAGAPQGQDAQGADGAVRRLRGRPRGTQHGQAGLRIGRGRGRRRVHEIHLAGRPQAQGFLPAHARTRVALAQVDRCLQHASAGRGALSGRAVRHRLRQTGNARRREGRHPALRLLRGRVGRPRSPCAGWAPGTGWWKTSSTTACSARSAPRARR